MYWVRVPIEQRIFSKFNKFNYLIENRTRDLPACSILPQPTTLPRDQSARSFEYAASVTAEWSINLGKYLVWFEVLTERTMKCTFLNVTACSLLEVHRGFVEILSPNLQGQSKSSKEQEKILISCFLPVGCLVFFRPWKWRQYFHPKRRWTSNGLHGVRR
jgi:hypothetical protein